MRRPLPRFGKILLRVPPVCGPCIETTEEDERRAEDQEAGHSEQGRLHARRAASGIPSRLRELQWRDLVLDERRNAIEASRRFSCGEIPGLMLTGSVGAGKTRIAGTSAWAFLEHDPLHWFSAPLLFARLGEAFGSRQRDEALEVLTGTMALVLDDLDKVRATPYAAEHIFLAIDGRITEGAPLLVTTNLTLDALADKFPEPFGPAIASRLAEYCEVFLLEGVDRRLEPPNEGLAA